jgi:Trypsin-like peptidase domain
VAVAAKPIAAYGARSAGGLAVVFRNACTLARGFTLPVVTSIQTLAGDCAAGIGTAIVVNDEEWIVTAAHVLKQLQTLSAAEAQTRAFEAQIAAVKNDQTLSSKNRNRKLNALGRLDPKSINRWSVWLGYPGITIESARAIEEVDIGIARLKNFDPNLVKQFPVFKDPLKDYEPGVSLCRMGYPFVDAKPVWNAAQGQFNLTQNVPLPVFPNEGILARMAVMILTDAAGTPHDTPPHPFPLFQIETSSAGILGQSGGAIFDQHGTVWGIQSATTSYQIDLNVKVQQYYHVGVGVHTQTILGFFNAHGVKHQVSTY